MASYSELANWNGELSGSRQTLSSQFISATSKGGDSFGDAPVATAQLRRAENLEGRDQVCLTHDAGGKRPTMHDSVIPACPPQPVTSTKTPSHSRSVDIPSSQTPHPLTDSTALPAQDPGAPTHPIDHSVVEGTTEIADRPTRTATPPSNETLPQGPPDLPSALFGPQYLEVSYKSPSPAVPTYPLLDGPPDPSSPFKNIAVDSENEKAETAPMQTVRDPESDHVSDPMLVGSESDLRTTPSHSVPDVQERALSPATPRSRSLSATRSRKASASSARPSEDDVTEMLVVHEPSHGSTSSSAPKTPERTPLFLPSVSPLTPGSELGRGGPPSHISISSSPLPLPAPRFAPTRGRRKPPARSKRPYVAVPPLPPHVSRVSYKGLMNRPLPSPRSVADNSTAASLVQTMQAAFNENSAASHPTSAPEAGPSVSTGAARKGKKRLRVESDSDDVVMVIKKRKSRPLRQPSVNSNAIAGPSRKLPESRSPDHSVSLLPAAPSLEDGDLVLLSTLIEPSPHEISPLAYSAATRHIAASIPTLRKSSIDWFRAKTIPRPRSRNASPSTPAGTAPASQDVIKKPDQSFGDEEALGAREPAPPPQPISPRKNDIDRPPTSTRCEQERAPVAPAPPESAMPLQTPSNAFALAHSFPLASHPPPPPAYHPSYIPRHHPDGPMLGFPGMDHDDSEMSIHMGMDRLAGNGAVGGGFEAEGGGGIPWGRKSPYRSDAPGDGGGGTIDPSMLGGALHRNDSPDVEMSPPPTTISHRYRNPSPLGDRASSPDLPLAGLQRRSQNRTTGPLLRLLGPRKPSKTSQKRDRDTEEPVAGPSKGAEEYISDDGRRRRHEHTDDDEYTPRTSGRPRKISEKMRILEDEAAADDLRAREQRERKQHIAAAEMTSCHHCRRTTAMPKMRCTRITEGGPCGKRFCVNCVVKRYPEITFNPFAPLFICPRCTDTCNCTVCSRKRGEEYVPERRTGRKQQWSQQWGHVSAREKHHGEVVKAKSVSSSVPPRSVVPKNIVSVDTTLHKGLYWGAVFSVTGERMGTAYGDDDNRLVLAPGPPVAVTESSEDPTPTPAEETSSNPRNESLPSDLVLPVGTGTNNHKRPTSVPPAILVDAPSPTATSTHVGLEPQKRPKDVNRHHLFVGKKRAGWGRASQVKDGIKTVDNKTNAGSGMRLYVGELAPPPRRRSRAAAALLGALHIDVAPEDAAHAPSSPMMSGELTPLEDDEDAGGSWPNEHPMPPDWIDGSVTVANGTEATLSVNDAAGTTPAPTFDSATLSRIFAQLQPS